MVAIDVVDSADPGAGLRPVAAFPSLQAPGPRPECEGRWRSQPNMPARRCSSASSWRNAKDSV